MPTPAELRAEITTGPLAAALAAPWGLVFADGPASRVGRLTPDGVAGLLAVLSDPARGRTRVTPLALSFFHQFLMSRGLVRPIQAGIGNEALPAAARDICAGLTLMLTGGGDRERLVDMDDPGTAAMVDALVATGIASAADKTALLAFMTRPCSRLAELGWSVTEADLQAAKALN